MTDDIMNMAQSVEKTDWTSTKEFETWLISFGKARVDWKRWMDSRRLLSASIDPAFIQESKRLQSADVKHWDAIKKMKKELDLATGRSLEADVFKMFKLVFKQMRSRNELLLNSCGTISWKLTVGPQGFGKRRNIQSADIDISSMWEILKEYKGIAEALKKQGLPGFADQLTRFATLVPGIEQFQGSFNLQVNLKDAILIPPQRSYHSEKLVENELPRIADKISFGELDSYHGGKMTLTSATEDKKFLENDRDSGDNDFKINSRDERDAIVCYQLHRQMEYVVAEYVRLATPVVQGAATLKERMHKEFGKELLMASV